MNKWSLALIALVLAAACIAAAVYVAAPRVARIQVEVSLPPAEIKVFNSRIVAAPYQTIVYSSINAIKIAEVAQNSDSVLYVVRVRAENVTVVKACIGAGPAPLNYYLFYGCGVESIEFTVNKSSILLSNVFNMYLELIAKTQDSSGAIEVEIEAKPLP